MGTGNFNNRNASNIFAVETEDEWAYEDSIDNVKSRLEEKFGRDFVEETNKWEDGRNGGAIFGYVELDSNEMDGGEPETIHDVEYQKWCEVNIKVECIVRTGYYSGMNYDWNLFVTISTENTYDMVFGFDELDDIKGELSYNFIEDDFAGTVIDYITTKSEELISGIEEVYKENTTPLVVTARFSNGETMYAPAKDDTVKEKNAVMDESKKLNQGGYEFYNLLSDGRIESGWEYKEDAKDHVENDAPKDKRGKVTTTRGLKNKGIDPDDDSNWVGGVVKETKDEECFTNVNKAQKKAKSKLNEAKFEYISKKFNTIEDAENYQEDLYDLYDHVKLIKSPSLNKFGAYQWEVKKKAITEDVEPDGSNTYSKEDFENDRDKWISKGGLFAFEATYIDENNEEEHCHGDIEIGDSTLSYSANSGCVESFDIDIDYDFSLDENLNVLYEELNNKINEAGFEVKG